MRCPLIAGNWKMNLDRAGAVGLASAVAEGARGIDWADVAVFPPHVYIDAVRVALAQKSVAYGAQNVSDQPNGALTGEISTAMLVDLGCRYVILGHSERRHILGETNEQVNAKTRAALAAGLTPIVCVGETLAEREAGHTALVIREQFDRSLANVSADDLRRLVIAYEPVWAIGTGKVATPAEAEAVHMDLRKLLKDRYNVATADAIRILYGGSVKASNAGKLLAQPNVDGALVGGASLKADEFLGIARGIKPR
jgi:triosephosphate isomerase (TIM)